MAAYKIIYSPEATERLEEVFTYVADKWGAKAANNFINVFLQKVELLKINPQIGKVAEKDKAFRSISITKHNRLYYSFVQDIIMLASLIDTRQDPIKNKFE